MSLVMEGGGEMAVSTFDWLAPSAWPESHIRKRNHSRTIEACQMSGRDALDLAGQGLSYVLVISLMTFREFVVELQKTS